MLEARKVVRGLLTRFLPACAAMTAAGIWYFAHGSGGDWLSPLVVETARMSLSMTLGAWLVLALFRGRMDPDTPVDARPSVIAGLLAPFAFFSAAVFVPPILMGALGFGRFGIPAAVGALVTFGMFFPWLSHAKPRGATSALSRDDGPPKLAEPFDVKMGAKSKAEVRKR